MSRLRFVLALAWRESRASGRRFLLIVLPVAIGTGALVAINSFTDNLRESVRREARELLGADLVLSSAGPFSERAETVLAEMRAATTPPARLKSQSEPLVPLRRVARKARRTDVVAPSGRTPLT